MKAHVITSNLDPLGFPPVGRWLKARRDVLGYSLAQVSEMTQMSEKTLQLLESESFLELTEPAFARSYLRRYAPCLRLDVQEVMALFDAWMLAQQAQYESLGSRVAINSVPSGYFTAAATAALQKLGRHARQANDAFDAFIHSKVGHAVTITSFIAVFSFFLSNKAGPTSTELLIAAKPPAASHTETRTIAIPREPSMAANKVSAPKTRPALADPSYLIATATTHVTVFDRNHLILFRGIVKTGRPVAISGLKPFAMQAARTGTILLVDAASLPVKTRHIAAL
ncbi:MAG: helix-turn-helix transcriptional regulator [Pseudomonadota bacterium]